MKVCHHHLKNTVRLFTWKLILRPFELFKNQNGCAQDCSCSRWLCLRMFCAWDVHANEENAHKQVRACLCMRFVSFLCLQLPCSCSSCWILLKNVCVCVCVWERERERERDRQTDRQRGKKCKQKIMWLTISSFAILSIHVPYTCKRWILDALI
jgi:hypothetical protein